MIQAVQHWNDQTREWEKCTDAACAFDHQATFDRVGYAGLLSNPACSRSPVCVWCATGRRHHTVSCVVISQPMHAGV